jgi:hypothetical protein
MTVRSRRPPPGDAIHPAAVATTKCPPLPDRDMQAHGQVGFAEASEIGDIPEIIGNDRGLYEGDLAGYLRVLNLSRNKPDPPISQPAPHAACDLAVLPGGGILS